MYIDRATCFACAKPFPKFQAPSQSTAPARCGLAAGAATSALPPKEGTRRWSSYVEAVNSAAVKASHSDATAEFAKEGAGTAVTVPAAVEQAYRVAEALALESDSAARLAEEHPATKPLAAELVSARTERDVSKAA